jgi:hypothetical protein
MKTSLKILVAASGLAAIGTLTSCTTRIETPPTMGVTTTTEAPGYYGATTTQQRTVTTRY